MKILITGGGGYIGSVLTDELLKNNFEVTVIDNFYYGQISLLEHCIDKNFNVINEDVRNEEVIKKLMKNVDIVIPLAAIVGAPPCEKDKVTSKTVNYEAIKMLLKYKSKNQFVIYPNTNSGYGIGEEGIYCTEETPLRPISFYGKVKKMSEDVVMEYENVVTLRLATVFGTSPRMRMDLLVNDFTYRALNDRFIVLFEEDFKRNYIHIRDVARAFIHTIKNFNDMKNQIYNLGLSNANLSKKELCQKIKEYLPDFHFFSSTYSEDIDKRNYIVSNEKIEKTGFTPFYSLDDGIKELIKAYQIINNNKYTNL